MGFERRAGSASRYLYVHRREGGRKVRDYYGREGTFHAEMAALLAAEAAHERRAHAERRAARKNADLAVRELLAEATALATETLEAIGYRRLSGRWRLRGGSRQPQSGPTLGTLHRERLRTMTCESAEQATKTAIEAVAAVVAGKETSRADVIDRFEHDVAVLVGLDPLPAEVTLATVVVLEVRLGGQTARTKVAGERLDRFRRLLDRRAKPVGMGPPRR